VLKEQRNMGEPFWSTFDNSTDGILEVLSSTDVQSTTPRSPGRRGVSLQLLTPVGVLVGVIGTCANAVVLAVLIRARREFGSSTHRLITNQSAMDLYACATGILGIVVNFAHGYTDTTATKFLTEQSASSSKVRR